MTATVLNTKIIEVENKLLDTSRFGTTTILNAKIGEVESKIGDHVKYITTQEFNKLTAEKFATRLKQANLVSKFDFDKKLISVNKKITSRKTKYLEVQNKLNSLTTTDYNFFLGRMLQVMMDLKTLL